MTSKKYLNQIQILDIKIQQKIEERDKLRLLAASAGGFDYSREHVQTSNTDNIDKKVINYVALEEDINKMIKKYLALRDRIIGEIQGLDSAIHITILLKKYVERKDLGSIAAEMGYSYNYVKHLHRKALQVFQKKYSMEEFYERYEKMTPTNTK